MRIRTAFTAAVVTCTLAAAAFAGTIGAATAATAPRPAGVTIRTVNLHSQFAAELGHVTAGRRAGVVPMIGAHGAAPRAGTAAPSASCAEPDCNMSYHGGPVQHAPRVILDFWGPNWATDTTQNTAEQYLALFFYGLGQTKYDDWSTITSQYSDTTGHAVFGKSVAGTSFVTDTSTPPTTVTPDNLAAEAAAVASFDKVTDFTDTQIIVASQSGTCFSDGFAGNCGTLQSSGYCAWHSAATGGSQLLPFVNLPFVLDAGTGCGEDFVNPTTGTYDGFSMTGGHEYAEAVTDPLLNAWNDAADNLDGGGEIGDKCIYGGQPFGLNDPFGNITLPTPPGSTSATLPFAVQSLWSNATSSCKMGGRLTFTVGSIGNQKSVIGKTIASVKLTATVSGGTAPVTFTAAHLPPGLSIGKSTGVINGTPGVTAGTFTPTVTAAYYDGSKSVTFSWQVSSAPGPVKGYASKCVDDFSGHTANGTKIDIWSCTGGNQQKIVFAANGELQVLGKCVTGGSTAFLEPCAATTNQVWTRQANGEYVLKSTGKCLTDPGNSTTNGKQLALAACTNTANQHWSLP